VKHKGAVVASVPKNRLRRVTIASAGVSLSSDCIHQCCKRNVSIEFLSRRGEPFAMIYTPQFAITRATSEQLAARDGEAGSFLACQFLKGKAKNQINLLKYFNKYLARTEPEAGAAVAAEIERMERMFRDLKIGKTGESREGARNRLMGVEGGISRCYWSAVRRILPPEIPFEKRIGQGAKDVVNSCLNYGYGMLYNRVQQALADAGAALHVSFLHEPRDRKPTLVYDLIEEFRQFSVDRTVIAMFNRGEPLRTDKRGWLTGPARQLVARNVRERLGSYMKWRRKQWKVEDIVFRQARLLMRHVRGEARYRPFIGRY
jgi:CRISPR-associated endonuclease Cas1